MPRHFILNRAQSPIQRETFEGKNLARNMKFVTAFREAVTSSRTKKDRAFDAALSGAGSPETNDVAMDVAWDKFAAWFGKNH